MQTDFITNRRQLEQRPALYIEIYQCSTLEQALQTMAECFPGHTVVSDGWNTPRRCWMFHVEH